MHFHKEIKDFDFKDEKSTVIVNKKRQTTAGIAGIL